MKVIIVGGVAGGASAAARLRRMDEHAQIILLERGGYISYASCGLPYYVGGEIADREELTLQTPRSFWSRFRVEVRLRHEALAIDPEAKTLRIRDLDAGTEYAEEYDKLILSPGSEPVRPPIPGADDPRVFTLRSIPDALQLRETALAARPKTALVVGGGYIGLEMAENLARAGLAVTVAELARQVLAPLDYDMACEAHHYLRKMGVTLRLGAALETLTPRAEGIAAKIGGETGDFGLVVLAMGVRPDTKLAREAGLACNPRGAIRVDAHMRTSAPDIYAVGDAVEVTHAVSGRPCVIPLAGPASRQGRVAADHICGVGAAYKGAQGSAILRVFDMTVAATGLNEAAAREAGLAYDKVYLTSQSHAGYFPGARPMQIKVLFETGTGRLLGAQITGFDGVDKRCDVLAAAIRGGLTAFDLTDLELCYAPPVSSAKDPVNMAGYAMENLLTGRVRQYHWHDVADLPRDGSVTLLDVRTPAEYARGHIDGTVHIPVDELRERIGELDPAKPVYVNCQSGLRSYIACRMLTQRGFTAYNLAGGWRLWSSVMNDR